MRGLKNLGNTCYANAAVQALALVPAVTRYLLCWPDNERAVGDDEALVRAYASLLAQMYPKIRKSGPLEPALDTSEFMSALRARYPQFTEGEQHDAVEVMLRVVDSIECVTGKQFMDDIFCGKMEQTVQEGGDERVSEQSFGFISLDVHETSTLEELVADSLLPCYVSDSNTRIVRRVLEWPKTTIFTFNVFDYHFLITLPYTYCGRKLVAVILHFGDAYTGGHYGTAVRLRDQWWETNDASCSPFTNTTKGALVAKAYAAVYRM